MLISCPSCDKDYRVPSAAIPQDGREVRCSACEAVWFEAGRQQRVMAAAAASADVVPYPVIEASYAAPPRRPVAGVRAQQAALAVVYSPAPHGKGPAEREETGAGDSLAMLAAAARRWSRRLRRAAAAGAGALRRAIAEMGKPQQTEARSEVQKATAAARGRLKASAANRLTPARLAGWALLVCAVAGSAFSLTQRREAVIAGFPPAANLYARLPEGWLPGTLPPPGLSVTARIERYALSSQGPAVVVTGRVINDGEEAVPQVTLAAETAGGREVQTLPLPGVALPKGGERPFTVRALLPENTRRVVIGVSEAEAPPRQAPMAAAGPMGFAGPPPRKPSSVREEAE